MLHVLILLVSLVDDLFSLAYIRECGYRFQVKLRRRWCLSSELCDLRLQVSDQFYNIKAIILVAMPVQVKQGLELLLIGSLEECLKFFSAFFQEIIKARTGLVRSQIITAPLGVLELS